MKLRMPFAGASAVVTVIILLALPAPVSAELYTFVIPQGQRAGVCSSGDVTRFSYTIVASPPGLYNVLAASKPTYDLLFHADFADPGLPSPLLAMSILSPPRILVGARALPVTRLLRPQVMCLLLDNVPPAGSPAFPELPVLATIDVTWGLEGDPWLPGLLSPRTAG
jgi:hypothetical protein